LNLDPNIKNLFRRAMVMCWGCLLEEKQVIWL